MLCYKNRLDRALFCSTSWESHVRFPWPQQPLKTNPHWAGLGLHPWAVPKDGQNPCAPVSSGLLKYRLHPWKIGSEMAQVRIQIWDKGSWWKVDVVEMGSPSLFFHGGLLCFFLCPFLFVLFQEDPGVGDSCAAPVPPVCGSEDAPPVGRMCF